MANIQTEKQYGISGLRMLATVGVVFLHTCSTITQNADLFPLAETERHFLIFGNMIWRWTVPVFFMITGALLLKPGKDASYRTIWRKARRILLALFLFSIPFAALILIANGKRGLALVAGAFAAPFTGSSFSHLWYLYMLLGIYALLPVIKPFVENAEKKELRCALGIMFLLSILIPSIQSLTKTYIAFLIPISYPIFYVLLGYYLTVCVNVCRKPLLLSGVALILMVQFLCAYADFPASEWFDYDNPLIALQAGLIFCLFKDRAVLNKGLADRLWHIDRLCFGVYMIHPLFIHISYRLLGITPLRFGRGYIPGTLLLWLLFTGCSFLASFGLSRVGWLRKYVL